MTGRKQIFEWITVTLREAAWAPLGVFGFYLFGLAIGLYKAYPPVDIPTHFMGGVSITYFFRSAIRNLQALLGGIPSMIRMIFAFTCTGTTIILWEFYENAFDYLFGTTMVRGLEDTIMDMFIGLMGALVLTLFYRRS
jgi:ABC-type Mn2+/Zn2+ transport system permease subunit